MSHARGEVWQKRRCIGYFEYNGTVDIPHSRIYATVDDMHLNWRGDNMRKCECSGPPDEVILWTQYGGGDGFYWKGKACLPCGAIISESDDEGDGPKCTDGSPSNFAEVWE